MVQFSGIHIGTNSQTQKWVRSLSQINSDPNGVYESEDKGKYPDDLAVRLYTFNNPCIVLDQGDAVRFLKNNALKCQCNYQSFHEGQKYCSNDTFFHQNQTSNECRDLMKDILPALLDAFKTANPFKQH